jgi:hypothetical protein
MSDGMLARLVYKVYRQRQRTGLTPDGIGGNATLFPTTNKSLAHGLKQSVGTMEAVTKPLRTVMKS